jgi:RimJ/RimL family protein N-acetyltransferase
VTGRSASLDVRPFADRAEYELMIDYFLAAEEPFLRGMGVEPSRLPSRAEWIDHVMLDHVRPDAQKVRAYLAWVHEGRIVGHSSISHIKVGAEAFIHLHLWDGALRRNGLGTWYFSRSAWEFARAFRLQRLYSEPYAENPAPNRALLKSGFRFIKRHRTVPGSINFEQDVNRYVLDNPGDGEAPEAPGVAVS